MALIDRRGGPRRGKGAGCKQTRDVHGCSARGPREAARETKRRRGMEVYPLPRGEGLHI